MTWKDSVSHIYGLAVYVKEGHPFARDLSIKSSKDSYLWLRLTLLHLTPYFIFLYRSPSSLRMAFDAISSNIDEVLSINPSTNALVFGDLTFIIRTGKPMVELLL